MKAKSKLERDEIFKARVNEILSFDLAPDPYRKQSPQFLIKELETQTTNKVTKNWGQTRDKLRTNWGQRKPKLGTNWRHNQGQTGDKLGTKKKLKLHFLN